MASGAQRPALQPERVRLPAGWRLRVFAAVGSTNAVAAEAAEAGEPTGCVIVAEEQRSGRGRLGRAWTCPPGAGLLVSVLLRPRAAPGPDWGWLPLVAGLAAVRAVRAGGGAAGLKWPNDLICPSGAKLGGLLTQVVPAAVIVGLGLNVGARPDELPPGATSTGAQGCPADRETLLSGFLSELDGLVAAWASGDPGVRQAYRQACGTLGCAVRLILPGGAQVSGVATDVDARGRLVVDGRSFSAGDVVHLRPTS